MTEFYVKVALCRQLLWQKLEHIRCRVPSISGSHRYGCPFSMHLRSLYFFLLLLFLCLLFLFLLLLLLLFIYSGCVCNIMQSLVVTHTRFVRTVFFTLDNSTFFFFFLHSSIFHLRLFRLHIEITIFPRTFGHGKPFSQSLNQQKKFEMNEKNSAHTSSNE